MPLYLLLHIAPTYLYPRFPHGADAGSVFGNIFIYLGIGVADAKKHPFDPCFDDGFGAGWRLAMMRTGFQRHIEIGPFSLLTCHVKCHHFSMMRAITLGVRLCDHLIIFHHNSAHKGIGRAKSTCFFRLFKGYLHIFWLHLCLSRFLFAGSRLGSIFKAFCHSSLASSILPCPA